MGYLFLFLKKSRFWMFFIFTVIIILVLDGISSLQGTPLQAAPNSYQLTRYDKRTQTNIVSIPSASLPSSTKEQQLASYYYWQGKYQLAIDLWESLLKSLSPVESIKIHGYLGVAYQEIGKIGRAIHHFKVASEFYEAYPQTNQRQFTEVLIAMGQSLNELGQGKRAMVPLQQALSITENNNFPRLQTIAYRHLLDFG